MTLEQPVDWHTPFCWGPQPTGSGLTDRHFRLVFALETVPTKFVVHVTADSRYCLRVNGEVASRGPFKGTLQHYHVECPDIAPLLRPGKNVLTAEVRWFGENAPQSEVHSSRPGWLLHCPDRAELNTPGTWRTRPDDSVRPDTTAYIGNAHQFLNHTERVDLRRRDGLDWHDPHYDDSAWEDTTQIGPMLNHGKPWGLSDPHTLFLNKLPQLTDTPSRFVRTWQNQRPAKHHFGNPPDAWLIAAGKADELILDAGELTTGYLDVSLSGGADREVRITYGEAMGQWRQQSDGQRQWTKHGRRDDPTGDLHGYRDTLHLSGREETYTPFAWRTFRFVKIEVLPGQTACTLTDVSFRRCVFPQTLRAHFASSDPQCEALWTTSWRTAQLCAHETYEDCPYYEQLNYIADTRLQAQLSYYLGNEPRLARRCLRLYRDSLRPDGLIGSRVPSVTPQIIPYFSLHWIFMLEDYWQWTGLRETTFVRSCLPVMDHILVFFRDRLRSDGFVGPVPPWNMVDQRTGWVRGEPPAVVSGASTWLTAVFALAVETAIRLHGAVGQPCDAARWQALPAKLTAAVQSAWSDEHGQFLEGPLHRNDEPALLTQCAVVAAQIPTPEQQQRLTRRFAEVDVCQVKLMQSHYLTRTLEQLGLYHRFHDDVLRPWRTMLANGTSTWWEYPDPTRSDCHAWSSWIAVDFLSSVLGIRPGAPGWSRIRIAPQINGQDWAEGSVTTPVGRISVAWRKSAHGWHLKAETPPGIPVDLELPDGTRQTQIPGGALTLEIPAAKLSPSN